MINYFIDNIYVEIGGRTMFFSAKQRYLNWRQLCIISSCEHEIFLERELRQDIEKGNFAHVKLVNAKRAIEKAFLDPVLEPREVSFQSGQGAAALPRATSPWASSPDCTASLSKALRTVSGL